MNTDSLPDLQRGSDSQRVLREATRKIIGLASGILNEVGHGLNEKAHENARVVLRLNNLRAANLRVGLILSFSRARLEGERDIR